MNEKIYQFNEHILGYDKGINDRSCLTISKIQNGNMYVMSSLYDGSADVISLMLDSLQKQDKDKEIDRLNNIINELEKWLKEKQILYGINQQGFSWGVCGDALDKLKELKNGGNNE